jgi:hypothetical protein
MHNVRDRTAGTPFRALIEIKANAVSAPHRRIAARDRVAAAERTWSFRHARQ